MAAKRVAPVWLRPTAAGDGAHRHRDEAPAEEPTSTVGPDATRAPAGIGALVGWRSRQASVITPRRRGNLTGAWWWQNSVLL